MITTKLLDNFTETKKRNNLTENRLLAALSPKEFRELLPDMETVSLVLTQVLYKPGDVIRYVYFPLDSLVSLLSAVDNRSTLEVGLVGNEGMTGIGIFLGVKNSRFQAVVQGAGDALRMKTSDLRRHSENNYRLKSLLQLYTHALLTHVSQSAACNRFHLVEARLARWLLATRDRLDKDKFQQTQEFLSNMLGVRREMVNKAAGTLQKRGLITYVRGVLTILDNAGLKAASCGCYEEIKAEYDNFLGLKS
jgi:CRP-like cAMP-binding protein